MDAREHDPVRDEDPRLLRALREGAEPVPDDGAAERIADGAWARATKLRTKRRARWRPGGRIGLAAAAALLLAAGLYGLPGEEAAFAVEGEPVRVREGGDWSGPKRTVREGDVVEMQSGTRLVGRTGSAVVATRRSVFHVSEATTVRLTIQIEAGDLRVEGPNVRIEAGDLHVTGSELVPRHGIRIALGDAVASAPTEVQVLRGSAVVDRLGERLELGTDQKARLVTDTAAHVMRLALVEDWSASAPVTMACERSFPISAQSDADGMFVLVGTVAGRHAHTPSRPLRGFLIPKESIDEATWTMNELVKEMIVRFEAKGTASHVAVLRDVDSVVRRTALPVSEYAFEKGDLRVRVTVDAGGRVTLTENDGASTFDDLAALRRSRTDVADLFGDRLRD
jgi:hypothetical protein